jgi:Spy/CpxP family protein refolding chaperone
MRRSPVLRVLRQLNLTDAQKQQMRTIFRTSFQTTKAQRQELRPLTRQWREGTLTAEGLGRANELHKQLNEARKSTRTQLAALLTPDQKTKLEEIIKTRKAHRA